MTTFIHKTNKESIFDSTCQALVNPINCMGVMGKGLAERFKCRFPSSFKQYVKACGNGLVKPGKVFITAESGRFIVHFPTKIHWRNTSDYNLIYDGLNDMILQLDKIKIDSVAIPALGCGLGGLRWEIVLALIEAAFAKSNGYNVEIYHPL